METTVRKQIEQELEIMYDFMEADSSLCASAGIAYDYEKYLYGSFQKIAERVGVSAEEVDAVNTEIYCPEAITY